MSDVLERVVHVSRRFSWLLVLVFALGLGAYYGLGIALLILAGGVLLQVIVLFWSSLESLTGEAPMTLEEALSLSAPSAEEEQKQAVLRALKDLEYERGVGKISEDDYQELSKRYRADAKALLLAVDRDLSPALSKAEQLLAARLGRPPAASNEPAPEPASPTASPSGICSQCQTPNDPDARFCKRCGTALSEGSA